MTSAKRTKHITPSLLKGAREEAGLLPPEAARLLEYKWKQLHSKTLCLSIFRAEETSGSHLVPLPGQSRTNFSIRSGCSVIAVKF